MKTNNFTEKKFEVSVAIAKRHEEAKKAIESLNKIFTNTNENVIGNHEEKFSSLKNELNALLLD